jgi:hypothetical protein
MRLIDADALIEQYKAKAADEWNKKVSPMSWAAAWDEIIDDIENEPTVGGWISVKDRMPEEKENPYTKDYQEVLCVLSTRFGTDVRVYKFGKGHFWNGPQEIDRVISHWMPFPELPKEESNDRT